MHAHNVHATIVARLRAYMGSNPTHWAAVYDRVPPVPTYDYLQVGTIEEDDGGLPVAACNDATDLTLTLHAWSQRELGPFRANVAALAASFRDADIPLANAPGRVLSVEAITVSTFRDPDGITGHGVVTLTLAVH
jgi:hypothetical protein